MLHYCSLFRNRKFTDNLYFVLAYFVLICFAVTDILCFWVEKRSTLYSVLNVWSYSNTQFSVMILKQYSISIVSLQHPELTLAWLSFLKRKITLLPQAPFKWSRPRIPKTPRVTLAEVTFSSFLCKIQPTVCKRIANSFQGTETTRVGEFTVPPRQVG